MREAQLTRSLPHVFRKLPTLVHRPLPVRVPSPCSSQVSVLHEVRVPDSEHVNHLIAQPPFLQSVHHPESQTSIQHSSGGSPGGRDLRRPGGHCNSTVRVQQPELKGAPGYGEAMRLALSFSQPWEGAGQVYRELQAV